MVYNDQRTQKSEERSGPYKIVKRKQLGSYTLIDQVGQRIPGSSEQVEISSAKHRDQVGVVKNILDDKHDEQGVWISGQMENPRIRT
jgi:hypothetical protein